jgi:hypothetical protein
VLGVMSYSNGIRGVMVPSCIVMWVTLQLNTWHIDIWPREVEPKRGISIYCHETWNLNVAYRYIATRRGT